MRKSHRPPGVSVITGDGTPHERLGDQLRPDDALLPPRPSELVAAEIRNRRERKSWSQRQLAVELGRLGLDIDKSAVARIENGTRKVTVDELFVLAVALNVSPMALCLPHDGSWVRIAPGQFEGSEDDYGLSAEVSGYDLIRWWRGQVPLRPDWADPRIVERDFRDAAPAPEKKVLQQHPGVYAVWLAATYAIEAAGIDDRKQLRKQLLDAKAQAEVELDRLAPPLRRK